MRGTPFAEIICLQSPSSSDLLHNDTGGCCISRRDRTMSTEKGSEASHAQGRVSLGAHVEGLPPGVGWTKREDRKRRDQWNRQMLFRVLSMRTTVAFLGAGCSVPMGYPTWTGFAKKLVARTLGQVEGSDDKDRLQSYLREIDPPDAAVPPAKRLISILGDCRTILNPPQEDKALEQPNRYLSLLQELFQQYDRDAETLPSGTRMHNPHDALLELPVSRFVTSNYDLEMEKALERRRRVARKDLGLPARSSGTAKNSFTQELEYFPQLALFALAGTRANENCVFHCHGRFDRPQSMIVTEADYRKWYLTEESEAEVAFRQTIDLLFGSNPLLFVGFGLGDDDLQRPLRKFLAKSDNATKARPLFAILEYSRSDETKHYQDCQALYERFGIQVISYPYDETQNLAETLKSLREDWKKWKENWLRKPKFKLVQGTIGTKSSVGAEAAGDVFWHYRETHEPEPEEAAAKLVQIGSETRENQLIKLLNKDLRVVVVLGAGGTGKSYLARKVMKDPSVAASFKRRFFWTSYYADDSLTGLEYALNWLDPEFKVPGTRRSRLKKLLHEQKCLLVFDGFERLLKQDPIQSNEGLCYSATVDKLLEVISSPDSQSVVILTSRLWPSAFWQEQDGRAVRNVPNEKVQAYPVPPVGSELTLSSVEVPDALRLCGLLEGHVFGLALAYALTSRKAGCSKPHCTSQCERQKSKVMALCASLARTPPDRRASRVIGESIRCLDEGRVWEQSDCEALSLKAPKWDSITGLEQLSGWGGLALKFLERLAVFMQPVHERAKAICFEAAVASLLEEAELDNSACEKAGTALGTVCEDLVKDLMRNLLIQEFDQVLGSTEKAWTLHPTVRAHIFARYHHASSDFLPNLSLPGFTSGTANVDPGSEQSVDIVRGLLDRIHKAAEDEIPQKDKIDLCRHSFGIVRSRMSAVTVPRWGTYRSYQRILVRLANLCRDVASDETWDFVPYDGYKGVCSASGPLYADELAWLYNEIGLSCYAEGAMSDALALWDQGYVINQVIDGGEPGAYVLQSLCNLGAANIEYGNLGLAEWYLLRGLRVSEDLGDVDHSGRHLGYLGLVQHLRGDFDSAIKYYRRCLNKLETSGGNKRASSIFMQHLADVYRGRDRIEDARRCVTTSRALAESEQYLDLTAHARCSLGHLLRHEGRVSEARLEYEQALRIAKQHGIRKLESDVLSELSRLAYQLGDHEIARQRAIEALQIANELSLGLRQTHGLVVLGKATIRAGQQELGRSYLRHAIRLAEEQQYWLRRKEAEEALHGIEASPVLSRI